MFTILHPIVVMVVPAIGGLILFCQRRKSTSLAAKSFFLHYAFGFFMLSLAYLPILVINLRIFTIDYNFLIILYVIAFMALLFSYVCFYGSIISILSKNSFFTTILPILLPIFIVFIIVSLFLTNIEHFIIYTVVVWSFITPVGFFLGCAFFYFFIKGMPLGDTSGRLATFLLCVAWIFILFLDFLLWFNVAKYNYDFWILKIASLNGYFYTRVVVYLFILIGALYFGKGLQRLKNDKIDDET